MLENEAIEYLNNHCLAVGHILNPPKKECEHHNSVMDMAIQALEEIQQYRAIGTVEEFKTLKEKAEPKKIFHQGYEYRGEMIYPIGINGVPYDLCPNCKTNLCTDGYFGRDKKRLKYCENCGQKLDWT